MSIYAGVGLSRESDPYTMGYSACKMAIEKSGGGKPDLLVSFSSPSFNQQELVQGIREAGWNAPLIGCTAAGEITGEGPVQKSLAIMAIKTDRIKFYTGLARDIKLGARKAGQNLAKEIKEKAASPLKVLMMLPDILEGNGADIVRGALDVLGAHFPVMGGAAGDDFLFEKTYEYRDDEVTSGAVAGVGMAGDFYIGAGVRHGWMPIGMPMKVTRSKDAIVYELDNRPAVSIYEEYFGKNSQELRREPLARMAVTYPLGIKYPGIDEYLIRDPITVDEKGAMTCAAEIPEGSEVRLMIGSKEKAMEAARLAASVLVKKFTDRGSELKFVLMFNCVAREKLFGQKAKEEIQAVVDIIGKEVPLLGFYTYGEQAPVNGDLESGKGVSLFHNETIVLFGVGE